MTQPPNVAAIRAILARLAATQPRQGLSARRHEAALGQLSDRAQGLGLQLVEVHREHLGNRPNDVAGLASALVDTLVEYANAIGKPASRDAAQALPQSPEVAGYLRGLAVLKLKAANTTSKTRDAARWRREAKCLETMADALEAN